MTRYKMLVVRCYMKNGDILEKVYKNLTMRQAEAYLRQKVGRGNYDSIKTVKVWL